MPRRRWSRSIFRPSRWGARCRNSVARPTCRAVQPGRCRGLRSTAIKGSLDPTRQSPNCCNGTGINYSVQGNTFTLRTRSSANSLDLDPTNISATEESAWGPVDGIVAKRSGTGSKTDTPLKVIPQTINVVTADEIKMRGSQIGHRGPALHRRA